MKDRAAQVREQQFWSRQVISADGMSFPDGTPMTIDSVADYHGVIGDHSAEEWLIAEETDMDQQTINFTTMEGVDYLAQSSQAALAVMHEHAVVTTVEELQPYLQDGKLIVERAKQYVADHTPAAERLEGPHYAEFRETVSALADILRGQAVMSAAWVARMTKIHPPGEFDPKWRPDIEEVTDAVGMAACYENFFYNREEVDVDEIDVGDRRGLTAGGWRALVGNAERCIEALKHLHVLRAHGFEPTITVEDAFEETLAAMSRSDENRQNRFEAETARHREAQREAVRSSGLTL